MRGVPFVNRRYTNRVLFLSRTLYKRVCKRLELEPEPLLIKHLQVPRRGLSRHTIAAFLLARDQAFFLEENNNNNQEAL